MRIVLDRILARDRDYRQARHPPTPVLAPSIPPGGRRMADQVGKMFAFLSWLARSGRSKKGMVLAADAKEDRGGGDLR